MFYICLSDGGGNSENKATFSGTVLLLAIISFVLGAVAIAVPHWGHFAPPGHGAGETQSWMNFIYFQFYDQTVKI